MKKLLMIACLLCTCFAAKADSYKFPPEVEELINLYEGTKDPVLPDPKALREEQDRLSVAPGRLPLPINVIINKRATRLYVVNVFGDTLDSYPICCARNRGQKMRADDCRTPEGNFGIVGVYNSSDWRYKGTGAKCYGPFFVSVHTPGFYGIGIHGTNAPGSVPGRLSHGCIRLHNENIRKLKSWVNKDTRITILPDDPKAEAQQIAQIKKDYVKPGTQTGVRVTDEEVRKYKEDHGEVVPPKKEEAPVTKPAKEQPVKEQPAQPVVSE